MSLASLIPIDFIPQPDPRLKDWIFSGFLTSVIFIPLCYLYAVFVWVPRYMRDRQPYQLKTYLIYYNIFQVIANTYLLVFGIHTLGEVNALNHVIYSCGEREEFPEHTKHKTALFAYCTLLLKLIDLSETIVFGLRKKTEQISALHLYHHVSVILVVWMTMKHTADTHFAFPILFNQFVHMLMYSYYLTTNLSVTKRKFFAPFKRYLTLFQMVQFVCILLHLSQFYLIRDCDVPTSICRTVLINVAIYLGLFIDFYRKSYAPPKKTRQH